MHVVEHIGLGRYGDPVDYDGDVKAMAELARVVKQGGTLLFVVPVGRPRIVYNAHRIYSYQHILQVFGNVFSLENFALITDQGEFIPQASEDQARTQAYGCGCFQMIKQRTDGTVDGALQPGW
jgi:ubiquinone/menaquinone biosynthesis C-methylase UbiE